MQMETPLATAHWSMRAATHQAGYVNTAGDCDDGDNAQYPNADEYCNGEDDDCDGTADENDALDVSTLWFIDADGDQYGDSLTLVIACDPPSTNYVTQGGTATTAARASIQMSLKSVKMESTTTVMAETSIASSNWIWLAHMLVYTVISHMTMPAHLSPWAVMSAAMASPMSSLVATAMMSILILPA